MIILKILGIAALIAVIFFVVTFTVYFFNLDMKLSKYPKDRLKLPPTLFSVSEHI